MLIRSLIVLLLALNIGVASWAALHAPEPDIPEIETPAAIARLQLAGEDPLRRDAARLDPPRAPARRSDTAVAPTVPPAPVAKVCASFGPFPDSATATTVRQRLLPLVTSVSIREAITGRPRGWKVYLPAYASVAEVEAAAQRVAAAGFADYFIVREGPEANTLALGRFGGEAPARRHAAALAAAGFPAVAAPIGSGVAHYWVDVSANDGFDAPGAQALVAAPERRALDCPVRD